MTVMAKIMGQVLVRVNHSLKGSRLAILFGPWFDPWFDSGWCCAIFLCLLGCLFPEHCSVLLFFIAQKQECLGRLLLRRQPIGLVSPYPFSILPQRRERWVLQAFRASAPIFWALAKCLGFFIFHSFSKLTSGHWKANSTLFSRQKYQLHGYRYLEYEQLTSYRYTVSGNQSHTCTFIHTQLEGTSM